MKTRTSILNAIAIAASITLTTSVAIAHSDHDHSTVPYKWAMSNDMKAKIVRTVKAENPSPLVGLSHFEQKKLNHYAIKTGNKFNTSVNGYNFLIERTSAGMRIVDVNQAEKVAYVGKVPIKDANSISHVSMRSQNHVGHNHAQLPFEWTFGIETQGKIIRSMSNSQKDVYVGLNKFEQSLLKEYDIKPGNSFHTSIGGHKFLVEKTSAGLKVLNYFEVRGVAVATHTNNNM
jgi:hypothetical protein